jgi:hypothetical protein
MQRDSDLSVPLRHKEVLGRGGETPIILNVYTSWRGVGHIDDRVAVLPANGPQTH